MRSIPNDAVKIVTSLYLFLHGPKMDYCFNVWAKVAHAFSPALSIFKSIYEVLWRMNYFLFYIPPFAQAGRRKTIATVSLFS